MPDEGASFSTLIRSSKCAKWIAISKLIISCLLSIALIVVAFFFSSSVMETIKKSSENFSATKFYVILVLMLMFLCTYAACCFTLLIGTINRDRMKVIVFLIADGVLTGIMLYVVILLPNILLIITLPIQVFLFYIIILWMQKLMKEHRRRLENRQSRKHAEESKISYQKEVERFHARLKIEEEDEEEV